ncbi:MAG: hypothetical protein KGS72_08370 [Cyanobacteria bacterium REEB67]|nr:hypothetical protein [Cyanobacteria bacterium REEB67]
MSATLSAFIFINREQALRFGHIAWGFELASGQYFYGSTDHLLRRPIWDVLALARYASVAPGDDVDYWSGQGDFDTMIGDMASGPHIRYHACKELPVPAAEARPEPAKVMAESFKEGGWSVLANNCVHQTHRLLSTFGAAHLLPDPVRDPLGNFSLIPVKFFALARGEARILSPNTVKSGSCP